MAHFELYVAFIYRVIRSLKSKRIYVEPGREIYHIYPIGVNRGMFTQIASGLAHIHSLNIVHRDLKVRVRVK